MSGRPVVVNCGAGRAPAKGFAGADWPLTGIDRGTIEIDHVAHQQFMREGSHVEPNLVP